MVHRSRFQVTSWPCHKDSMIQQLSSHTSASKSASLYLPHLQAWKFQGFCSTCFTEQQICFHPQRRSSYSSAASLRRPIPRPGKGPYKFFKIDIGGKADSVSIDRLKPAHLDPDLPVQVSLPPRRGRPPVKKGINGSGGGSCGGRHHADRTCLLTFDHKVKGDIN